MTPTDWEDLVRSSFAAYLTGTVPSSRDAYFEGCWANAGTFGRLDTEQVKATGEPEKNFDGTYSLPEAEVFRVTERGTALRSALAGRSSRRAGVPALPSPR
jgi:hypothetical protein